MENNNMTDKDALPVDRPLVATESNTGFRVLDRSKREKLTTKQTKQPGADTPDKSSSSSSEDESEEDGELPVVSPIRIDTQPKKEESKTFCGLTKSKPEPDKEKFTRIKLKKKWEKGRWEIVDSVPNAGDGIPHASAELKQVRRVDLKAEVVGKVQPKSPELVKKAPEFGPAMKPATISLITVLDGFAKLKAKETIEVDGQSKSSKSPVNEKVQEKPPVKNASPTKELEVLKEENKEEPSVEEQTPKPKPEKQVIETKRTVKMDELQCQIGEYIDYSKKYIMDILDKDRQSKEQLQKEVKTLKEDVELALSFLTKDQKDNYYKEQAKRGRMPRRHKEEPSRQELGLEKNINGPISSSRAKHPNPPKPAESIQQNGNQIHPYNVAVPGNVVRNNLGYAFYQQVPVARQNAQPGQVQPNSHFHQHSNGVPPNFTVQMTNMSPSPHLAYPPGYEKVYSSANGPQT